MFSKCNRFSLLVAAAMLCGGGAAHAESLGEAVAAALEHHPTVAAAQAGLAMAEEDRKEQAAGYFPEIAVSATGGRVFQDNSTSRGLSVTRGDAYSGYGEGNVRLTQPVFDGMETARRVEAAEVRKESAGAHIVDVQENLALLAVQAYLNILRARAGLALIREHGHKMDDYLGRIKIMVEEGAADEAELQQAQSVRTILEGMAATYEGQVRAAVSEYIEIIGHAPAVQEMENPAPRLDMIPENLADAVEQARTAHPAVRAAALGAEAVSHEVRAEKAALYPDIDGELSYLESDKKDVIGGEVIDGRAVLKLNWSFSTGGAQLARIRRKTHEREEMLARLHEQQRQIELNVRLAYNERETAKDQVGVLGKRVDLTEKLLEAYKVQFEGARIRILQLMQTENQFFNAKLERLNAQYRLLAAQYGVLGAMGHLQDSMSVSSLQGAAPAAGSENSTKTAPMTAYGQE